MELKRQLDQIRVGMSKLWVNGPRFRKAEERNRDATKPVEMNLVKPWRSFVEVVKGKNKLEINKERHPQSVTGARDHQNKQQKTEPATTATQVWIMKNNDRASVGLEFTVKEEDLLWLEGCYVGTKCSVNIIPTLQQKFFMEGYFSCKVRPMGGRLVLLEGGDKDEIKDLVETTPEWLGQWFEEIKPWSPSMVAGERFMWIRCQGIPVHAWGPEFFNTIGAVWAKVISLDDRTSKKLRFDIGRILISTPIMEFISKSMNITVNGVPYLIKVMEEEATNGIFSMKSDHVFRELSCSKDLCRAATGKVDDDDMARDNDVEHGSGNKLEEDWKESHKEEVKANRKKFEFEEDTEGMMSVDGSNVQTDNEYIDASIGKSQKFPSTSKSLGQNSNCKNGEMNGPTNLIQLNEKEWDKGCRLDLQACLRDDEDWALNMGPNKTNKVHEDENDVVVRDKDIDGFEEEEVNQRNKGCLTRLADISEEQSFWQGFESELGQLKAWMGREQREIKKQKKRMRSCSSVYRKSRIVVQQRMEEKRGKLKKDQDLEEMTPNFWSGSQEQVADDSLADSGIENRNKCLWNNGKINWGPKPFRFFDAWLEFPQFKARVGDILKTTVVNGWNEYRLKEKLKETKKMLKVWSKNMTSEIDLGIQRNIDSIASIDKKCEVRPLSPKDIKVRRLNFLDLWKNQRIKESMWRQKARKTWISDGDANTKFFHKCVKGRRRINDIASIMVGSECLEEVNNMKEGVANYFETLFKEDAWHRPALDGIQFKKISKEEREMLEAPFNEEEVRHAVWDCESSKALGLDGFNFKFVKKMWETLKDDIMGFVTDFHKYGKLVRGLNSSFIALVPKVTNPQKIEEFIPISLVGAIYELIAKLLACRLSSVLNGIIRENQMAFVGGRQLVDSVVIANETIDEVQKRKKEGFVFKANFEKAYDKVCWDFLDYMMLRLGFGLNGIISSVVSLGLFKGIEIGHNGMNVSHLQFADDTIVFGRASEENIWAVKSIIRIFEMVSGLKINFGKSLLMGINVSDEWMTRMSSILNCKQGNLPCKYLGMPIGGKHRSMAMWRPMIDSFKKKLAGWKNKFISLGGRIMLLNSVLSSLLVFTMFVHLLPKGLILLLDKIHTSFLWGGGENNRKINWVCWENVCRSKLEGGLGVKDLRKFNLVLLGKWWSRLAEGEEGLLYRVIREKYGSKGGNWLNWIKEGN
ncbi:hypothetical protein SLEP1_g7819 [Rubroshorea leprosula]|uniref:Reverse transcriptase domain-containing protein n=1 Tax=Rubroshorea leprosula TaxID=152421 RepID=A0AAV5I9H2_9ROSI|nr:hypothetical protein SLEP1_g7819 [Rubroshorea leprosula]